MCMYWCMRVCIHVYMQVCTYVSMYVCVYVFMHVCMYVFMYVFMYEWWLIIPKHIRLGQTQLRKSKSWVSLVIISCRYFAKNSV